MAVSRNRFYQGDAVGVTRDYASLCNSRGDFIRVIPVGALGVVLAYDSRIASYFVSWDFGRSGWVLRDNLTEASV